MIDLDLTLPDVTIPTTQPVREFLLPLPQPGHFLAKIDNTAMEGITKCPTFAFNNRVLHREAHARNASLTFGGAVHEGIKHMLLGDPKATQDQAIIQYFTENPTPPDEYRTPTMALRVMREYRKQHDLNPFEVIIDGGDKLVETAFEVPLIGIEVNTKLQLPDWPEPQFVHMIHVAYTGRIDLVAHKNDQNVVVDHKTTSVAGEQYIQSFHLSSQAMGYVWAANKLWPNLNVTSFCLNGIGLRRCRDDMVNITAPGSRGGEPPLTFFQAFYHYSLEQLEEWEENAITIIQDFIHCVVRDFYPLFRRSCFDKFGQCQYWDACTLENKAVRRRFLLSDNFKPVTWDPTL